GTERSSVVPSPSWPKLLFPQQSATPSERRAQVWAAPAASASTSARIFTATGVSDVDAEPSPSWPELLLPQQTAVPSPRRAQVWLAPAAISAAPSSPGTGPGVSAPVARAPAPSCPTSAAPQHQTEPPAVTAQLCRSPAATPTTPERPATGAGAERVVVDPSP